MKIIIEEKEIMFIVAQYYNVELSDVEIGDDESGNTYISLNKSKTFMFKDIKIKE